MVADPGLNARGVDTAHGASACARLDQRLSGGIVAANPTLRGRFLVAVTAAGAKASVLLDFGMRRRRRRKVLKRRYWGNWYGLGLQGLDRHWRARQLPRRGLCCGSWSRRRLGELGEQFHELGVTPIRRPRLTRELPSPGLRRGNDTVALLGVGNEEGDEANKDRFYGPSRIPALGMEVRHAQAQATTCLKAAARRDHEERRRSVWVLWWEDYLPMVAPIVIRSIGGERVKHKVPFQQVVPRGQHGDLGILPPLQTLELPP
mmetsp:Transcript_64509/g.144823  ORF Transcript_64509/g.144823 Transcript_64509/m.144823 type:complete len:261 (+) Transcript_64509:1112-1894(+)